MANAAVNAAAQEPALALAPLPSPLDAVDDLRAAAKWTLAAAGVVGAALISGGPLVAVGQVHGLWHDLLAGAGLALALVGVGIAIWFTGEVLAPRLTTRETLMSPELAGLRQVIDADPGQFFGAAASSMTDLFKHQDDKRETAADLARQVAAARDGHRREVLDGQLRRVEGDVARIGAHVRWLMALAHVWKMQADLRRSRWYTLGGGLLVVVGAVLFFVATSGTTYVPVLTPQVTATPTAAAPSSPRTSPSPAVTP